MADPTQAILPPALIGTGQEGLGDVVTLNALNQLTQGQAQQPAPTAPSLRPNLPAIVRLIADMHSAGPRKIPVNEQGQAALGTLTRPHSRLDAFESFLGNFATSLAAGLGAAHGYGAFGKGFAAAAVAPQQQAITQFGLQREAALTEAQQQEQQARTQLTQTQAQLAPQELELRRQQVMAEFGLRHEEMVFNQQFREAMLNLNTRKEDFSEGIKKLQVANEQFRTQLTAQMNAARIQGIQAMIGFRSQDLALRKNLGEQAMSLRAQANQLRQQGLAQEADRIDILAGQLDNKIGIIDEVESSLGMVPRVQAQTGGRMGPAGGAPVVIPPANRVPQPQAKGGTVVDNLANKYK